MNNVITIPQKGEFVLVPKKEYELMRAHKIRFVPLVKATKAELRAIKRSEREIQEGKYIEWNELKRELANRRNRSRRKAT